jgi:hypothetical protein
LLGDAGSSLGQTVSSPVSTVNAPALPGNTGSSVAQAVSSTVSTVETIVVPVGVSVAVELPPLATVAVSLSTNSSAAADPPASPGGLALDITINLPVVGTTSLGAQTGGTTGGQTGSTVAVGLPPAVSTPPVSVSLPTEGVDQPVTVNPPTTPVSTVTSPATPVVVVVHTPTPVAAGPASPAPRVQLPTEPVATTEPAGSAALPAPPVASAVAAALGNGPAFFFVPPAVAQPVGVTASIPFYDPRLNPAFPGPVPAEPPAPAAEQPMPQNPPDGVPMTLPTPPMPSTGQGDSGSVLPTLPDGPGTPAPLTETGPGVQEQPRAEAPPAELLAPPRPFAQLVDPAADGAGFQQTVQQFLNRLAEAPAVLQRTWGPTAVYGSLVALAVTAVTWRVARRRRAAPEPENWFPHLAGLDAQP